MTVHVHCDFCGGEVVPLKHVRLRANLLVSDTMFGATTERRDLDFCSWTCVEKLAQDQRTKVPYRHPKEGSR